MTYSSVGPTRFRVERHFVTTLILAIAIINFAMGFGLAVMLHFTPELEWSALQCPLQFGIIRWGKVPLLLVHVRSLFRAESVAEVDAAEEMARNYKSGSIDDSLATPVETADESDAEALWLDDFQRSCEIWRMILRAFTATWSSLNASSVIARKPVPARR